MTNGPIFSQTGITSTTYIQGTAIVQTPVATSPMNTTYYVGWHGFSDPDEYYLLMDDISIADDGVLPIQLAYLNAQMSTNGRSVLVNWGTLTEINNYGFWVQKSQNDQLHYQTIENSFVAGHGTTNEPQHYSFTENVASSGTWYYRLKQQDLDNTIHYTEGVRLEVLTSVKELAPKEFALMQNYPNPFNPSTEIKFSVELSGLTTLRIFNVLGQEVATLFNDVAEAGYYYKVNLDASSLGSGMYFYTLQSGQQKDIKKMLLLK
jgi:hypothetical protein